ncbi:hypothetical protein M758_12G094800 [Ceratodon purpureus]|nr:hypothetical protein M758_12G094800 [Ceratodon purpureus]
MGSLGVESWNHAPHVVVAPNALSGHSIPFLQFARRLASEGVVTTIVATDRHVLELRSLLGATDWTAQGVPLRILGLRDGKAELTHREWTEKMREREVELEVVRLMQELVVDVSSPMAQLLRGVEPAAAPVCVLHDMFVPWAQEVADRLGIEKHLLFVSNASALSLALQSTNPQFAEGLLPISKENRDLIISDIPGLPPIPALELPDPFLVAGLFDWMQIRHKKFRKADVILVNTFYELEKPVLDALRNEVLGHPNMQAKCILEIGPLLPESYVNDDGNFDITTNGSMEETDPCILWLNTRPPKSVLFVSFGSGATHPAPQLLEMAFGLEDSGCSFLWIVRPPGTPGMSATSENPGSVTEFLPPGFEERIMDRGMCYSGWAPQMRILKHSAVGGFLSHCGWNSSLETVCAGVPILAWPKGAEQHLNRRYLVDTSKLAIELEANPYTKEELEGDKVRPEPFYSREEIAKKVRNLMHEAEGQVVRKNIQRLRSAAREAGALGGSSRRNFEAYIRLLHNYGNCNGEGNGHSGGHTNGHSVLIK